MSKKVFMTECFGQYLTAVEEEDKIVELHYFEKEANRLQIGDIYIGKIKKVLPNIKAAFIDIGIGIDCYYSLDTKWSPIYTNKIGKKPYCVGDELLVQVEKDAVKTKQPTVTGNLNLSGQYTVVTSGNKTLGVSSKLPKHRKGKLQELFALTDTSEFGCIIRTNAIDATDEQILNELEELNKQMRDLICVSKTRTCYSCLKKSVPAHISILKDIPQKDLEAIVIDKAFDKGQLYEETTAYLKEQLPKLYPLVKPYTDQSYPMKKCYELETTTEKARKERVWLNSGAYLVIQPTEALTVIDVNSGKCLQKTKQYHAINHEAAKECARQIRLRNLSGMILIDFINLDTKEDQKELLSYLQKELNKDPNPGNVIDITKLQLVEITRKKIRKTLEESIHGKERNQDECNAYLRTYEDTL